MHARLVRGQPKRGESLCRAGGPDSRKLSAAWAGVRRLPCEFLRGSLSLFEGMSRVFETRVNKGETLGGVPDLPRRPRVRLGRWRQKRGATPPYRTV